MNARTQLRTMSTMLMLVVVVMFNTGFQLNNIYDARLGLPLYAVTVAVLVVTLRYQQRLSRAVIAGLLLLPIVLVVVVGLLSI